MDRKTKGKGTSPTRSATTRTAPTRSAQLKKTIGDVPIPAVVAIPSRVETLRGHKKNQASSPTAPTRTNPSRAVNKNKIFELSDDDSVITEDEIIEGAFSRKGLTRAALHKKKPMPGWSDGESEESQRGTIHPMEHSRPPTSDDLPASFRYRDQLHAMLDNFLDNDNKRDASAVAAPPTRATTAHPSLHDGAVETSGSGDFNQMFYNPLDIKNVLLDALIDNFFSKRAVAAPTLATTGCAGPEKEDSDEDTTPKRMAAAPTRKNPRPDVVIHDDSVKIGYTSRNVKKQAVNKKAAAPTCEPSAWTNHTRAALMKELLDDSDEDLVVTSPKMSGTPTGHIARMGFCASPTKEMQAAHKTQNNRRGAAIRDDSEAPKMGAAPTRNAPRPPTRVRVGAPTDRTATNRRVDHLVHRESFTYDGSPTPNDGPSSSDESLDRERAHFVSKLLARDIILDTDDEEEFGRMFANRAALTFGESP